MEKKSMFDQLPSKFAFWAGVVVSAAVFAIIGFIIMASLTLGDGGTTKKADSGTKAVAANDAAPAAPDAAVVPSGTIDLDSIEDFRGSGDLAVIEFSDLECPFCSRFHPTMQQVVEEYDGDVKWAYLHFPLTSIHSEAQPAAEASECAREQGQYWEFIDYIFANQATLGSGAIDSAVAELGLDADDFTTCVDNGTYTSKVNADAQVAQSLGGRGTPFSVIVDADGNILDTISGALPFESVKTQLDAQLN